MEKYHKIICKWDSKTMKTPEFEVRDCNNPHVLSNIEFYLGRIITRKLSNPISYQCVCKTVQIESFKEKLQERVIEKHISNEIKNKLKLEQLLKSKEIIQKQIDELT